MQYLGVHCAVPKPFRANPGGLPHPLGLDVNMLGPAKFHGALSLCHSDLEEITGSCAKGSQPSAEGVGSRPFYLLP